MTFLQYVSMYTSDKSYGLTRPEWSIFSIDTVHSFWASRYDKCFGIAIPTEVADDFEIKMNNALINQQALNAKQVLQ